MHFPPAVNVVGTAVAVGSADRTSSVAHQISA